MRNNQKVLFKMWVVYTIAVIIEPACFTEISAIHTVFNMCKIITACITIIVYVLYKMKLNALIVMVALFELSLSVSTIVNLLPIKRSLTQGAYVVILLMFMQVIFKIDTKYSIKAFAIVLGVYVHINLITYFLFPNGMYRNSVGYTQCWFLGMDNTAAGIIVVVSMISLYRLRYTKIKIWDYSVIISGVFFVFVVKSVTAIIMEICLLLCPRVFKWFWKKTFKCRTIVVDILILFGLVNTKLFQDKTLYLADKIEKGTSMSLRFDLWKTVWREIAVTPIIGNGVIDDYALHFHAWWKVNLHSYYLQIIHQGGIVAMTIFVMILLTVANKFDKNEQASVSDIAKAAFVSFLVAFLVESYVSIIMVFVIILFFLNNASEIEKTVVLNN